MRTKLIAIAAVMGMFVVSGVASAEGLHHCKRPLVTVSLSKQPTLVQTVPAPRKPL